MKNVFKTLMLPALLIVAACSNDTDEMMSARQSDEPTEKEMLQTQVKEIAEQYGVLVGFNEERWQKKLPSIVEIQDFIINSKEMMESRYSSDSIIACSSRLSGVDAFFPIRFKTVGEFHPSVSGYFTFWGYAPGAFVDLRVDWTDGGSEGPNRVCFTGSIGSLTFNNYSCQTVSFYATHHTFIAWPNLSLYPAICVQYNGSTGTAVLYFDGGCIDNE